MRILVVGTGGVGSAFASIAQRRGFFEHCALADYDAARAREVVAGLDDDRFSGHGIDASSKDAVVSLVRETRVDAVLNAVDPLFNVPIFDAAPFSEPEVFDFPEGIGPVECVNVEHEEVLLVPRFIECKRVTFKYGPGDEFIDVLKTLHSLGLDSKEAVNVKGVAVAPRDVVAASRPNPATLGDRMTGKTCAGTLVTGGGKDGAPRKTYLHHIVDNEWSMREYGSQAVVWQTAINPVIALELLASGEWKGTGVLGPEAAAAVPGQARRVRRAARGPRAHGVTGHAAFGHLAVESAQRDHASMLRRRRERATLDDVVELLRGIGTILMEIDSKLQRLVRTIEGDDDEEEA